MSTPSILDGPQAKTPAQTAAQTIRDNIPAAYSGLVATHNMLMSAFWQTDGATPQEVSDSLGAEAASVVGLQSALKSFILSVNPSEDKLATIPALATVTPNQDGTVTITGTP